MTIGCFATQFSLVKYGWGDKQVDRSKDRQTGAEMDAQKSDTSL